jgi:hypothetical protein
VSIEKGPSILSLETKESENANEDLDPWMLYIYSIKSPATKDGSERFGLKVCEASCSQEEEASICYKPLSEKIFQDTLRISWNETH